jgi:flagellin-like protein
VTRRRPPADRGQSTVVGVALLLAVTVVALGVLTASIGAVVTSHAAAADAQRVAADVEDALRPVETTGVHEGTVRFADGELRTADRQLRVLRGGRTVRSVSVGAVVYERGDRRVAFVAGAVVRGAGDGARFRRPPPVTEDAGAGGLLVGAPALNASDVAAGGDGRVTLRTRVTHRRAALGEDSWAVAVETETPGPFRRWFEERGASVSTRDFDGDGVDSVVAHFPGQRRAYLVVHAMHLEVDDRG